MPIKLIDIQDDSHDTIIRNAPTVVVGMANKEARNGLVVTTVEKAPHFVNITFRDKKVTYPNISKR